MMQVPSKPGSMNKPGMKPGRDLSTVRVVAGVEAA